VAFVADQLQTIFPQAVGETEGPAGPDSKIINSRALIPWLVKAVQELSAELQALKAAQP
jgi:hypothetical protein